MNPECELHRRTGQGNIRPFGWYKTKFGRRKRYRCNGCKSTFSSTTDTAYHRLKASRNEVELACKMSVKGVSIAVSADILNRPWKTIQRWLDRAQEMCKRFQGCHLHGYEIHELQADELVTFVGKRKSKTWIMAIIEVCSRLWPATRIGRRSYRNIRSLFGEALYRGFFNDRVFITTDGFKPYAWVLKRVFGSACIYGQVIKKWKKNRVTCVEREIIIGEPWQLEEALECSQDSEKLNTSFIERLNLTIRQGTSYLQRKTSAHARCPQALLAQLEFQRCYYNFMRPHMSLKFGNELYTPAMVAGIAKRKITWREILEGRATGILLVLYFQIRQNEERMVA